MTVEAWMPAPSVALVGSACVQGVLSAGSPAKMEAMISDLASKGEVDDALVLLLQVSDD